MSNSKKVNEKWSKKDYQKSSKRVYSRSDKAITLIALIVTIIVLLILAGVTINLAVNNQGIFSKARTATRAYKNASENEQTGLDEADKEIAKYMPKEGSEGGSDSETGSVSITYTDSSGNTKPLTKDTPTSDYGTKIGNTTITNSDNEEIKLDWYLFDVSDDGKTAYLVSTPTYWEPDTDETRAVSGAWVPKLVSNYDRKTGAMQQAIQKKESTTSGDYSYSYDSSKVNYNPTETTLNYFKSVNSQWSDKRGTMAFASLNENEQEACYLADADIFAGIKDQVNNANGNLKGKIQTLVGGASIEQWCKAYNKQTKVKAQQPNGGITCEYSTKDGYIYKVNGTVQNPGWCTDTNIIVGNDIYGAANTNNHSDNSTYPFSGCCWWLASPSCAEDNYYNYLCCVDGNNCCLGNNYSLYIHYKLSLFASVSL